MRMEKIGENNLTFKQWLQISHYRTSSLRIFENYENYQNYQQKNQIYKIDYDKTRYYTLMITDITSVGYKMHKKINILFNIKKFYIWNTISPINLLQPLLIFRVVDEYNQN